MSSASSREDNETSLCGVANGLDEKRSCLDGGPREAERYKGTSAPTAESVDSIEGASDKWGNR